MVLDYFPPQRRRDRAIRTLANILTRFIHGADLGTRLDAYAELREWTSATPAGSDTSRLEMVLQLMESRNELRTRFQREVRQILTEIRSVELFAEAGLHPREGMMSELWRRLDRANSAFGARGHRSIETDPSALSNQRGH